MGDMGRDVLTQSILSGAQAHSVTLQARERHPSHCLSNSRDSEACRARGNEQEEGAICFCKGSQGGIYEKATGEWRRPG